MPDTPVSISSKIMVGTGSPRESTLFSASMMRLSSPPEAMRLIRPSSSPLFADSRKRTSSAPFGPSLPVSATSVRKRAEGMLSS